MTKLEQMRKQIQERAAANTSNFEKFDYENRKLKTPGVGTLRVRILDNIDSNGFFFYEDGFHKIDDSTYIDCKDPKTCKVCKVAKELWDDNDEMRKTAYRTIKRVKRNTIQVVVLDEDGMVADKFPKLFSPAKTLMIEIMKPIEAGEFDPSDGEMDLLIVKEKDDRFYTYKDSKFIAANPNCDLSNIEAPVALDVDKYYNDTKALKTLKKYNKMFSLEVDLDGEVEAKTVVKKETTMDDDLDDFEKALLDEING